MEHSQFLNLTADQKLRRKEKYDEKQKILSEGKDPEKIILERRAIKATEILKSVFDGKIKLPEEEISILKAIVVKCSTENFYFFVKYPLDMTLMSDRTHRRWGDNLTNSLVNGKKRIMRLKPRGCYKSSMYGVGFILWLWACQSPLIRIFYTSASGLLINEISDKINQYIGTEKANTFFSYIFGITKDVNAKNTTDVFNILGRSGKGFSLILKTAGSSTVGIHPNIIIIDDPLDISDRESEATRQQKERWFDSLNPLLVPFYNDKTGIIFETIMYIGTVWHLRDLIWYITEVINPKLPKTEQWDVERESIYTSEGRSAYPEIISDDKLAVIKATMSETFFASQYMNSALPEGLQVFDLKRLTLVRPDQIDLSKGEVLCVFDPSLGKSSSDYPAVWWVHFHEDKLTFFDAIDKKTELSLLVHHIASRNKEYQCRRIIFEDNGTILIKESLTRAHKGIDHNIFIDSVHHSTPKAERIMSIQSDLYSGFARFMSDYEVRYPEAMNQIVFYGAYGADDFPDCAQIAIEHFRKKHFTFKRYESLL